MVQMMVETKTKQMQSRVKPFLLVWFFCRSLTLLLQFTYLICACNDVCGRLDREDVCLFVEGGRKSRRTWKSERKIEDDKWKDGGKPPGKAKNKIKTNDRNN